MANSYTNKLKKRLPAAADPDWGDEWHDNEKIDEVVIGALLSDDRVISGGAVTDGGGLTANWTEIVIFLNGAQSTVVAGNLLMTASQANWVYVDASSVVVTSLTPPSGDYIPLALVDTDSAAIVRIADLRPMADLVKDVSVPGLTQFKINFMNALGTIKSFFANANTAARTYTFKDRDGIIADDTDLGTINTALAGKAPLSSPALTDTPTAPTAAPGTNNTQIANTAFVTAAIAAGSSQSSILHVQDQKSTGTNGGSSSANTEHDRTLNTVIKNEIAGASLASNIITLPAGKYHVDAIAPTVGVGRCMAYVVNNANGAKLLVSAGSGYAGSATFNIVKGVIETASEINIKLVHWIQNAVADTGLGAPANHAPYEVYSEVIIEKVA